MPVVFNLVVASSIMSIGLLRRYLAKHSVEEYTKPNVGFNSVLEGIDGRMEFLIAS